MIWSTQQVRTPWQPPRQPSMLSKDQFGDETLAGCSDSNISKMLNNIQVPTIHIAQTVLLWLTEDSAIFRIDGKYSIGRRSHREGICCAVIYELVVNDRGMATSSYENMVSPLYYFKYIGKMNDYVDPVFFFLIQVESILDLSQEQVLAHKYRASIFKLQTLITSYQMFCSRASHLREYAYFFAIINIWSDDRPGWGKP